MDVWPGASLAAGALALALAARSGLRRSAAERQCAFMLATARAFAAAAAQSPAAVYAAFARAAAALAPVDCVFFEPGADTLACVHASGERVQAMAGLQIPLADVRSPIARSFLARHHVRVTGPLLPLLPTDRSALALPLIAGGTVAVVAYLGSARAHAWPDLAALQQIADLAAHAYRLAAGRQADRAGATYDALTGLLGPRSFRLKLAAEIAAASGAPARLALLFVDTDHFKRWNDTCGHAAGDAVLRAMAALLGAACRPGDAAARNGGDEFCLIFSGADKFSAIERAETLRCAIARYPFAPAARRGPVPISASIGVAAYPADALSAALLLEKADAAMYHSKRSGRNGVSYYGIDGRLQRVHGAAGAIAPPHNP